MPPRRGYRLISNDEAVRVCDLDEGALRIIENAPGKSYRRCRPHRAIRTANIINDFFEAKDFQKSRCIEFGPGHYNFALIARHLGAQVICVERDPVHAELGRHLGFDVVEEDIFASNHSMLMGANGLWLKNVQFRGDYTKQAQDAFVSSIQRFLTDDAWGWCVLRNRQVAEALERNAPEDIPELSLQKQAFMERKWTAYDVKESDRKRYAMNFAGAPWIFTLRLTHPPDGQ